MIKLSLFLLLINVIFPLFASIILPQSQAQSRIYLAIVSMARVKREFVRMAQLMKEAGEMAKSTERALRSMLMA